jgi:hypothetical protein
VLPARYFSTEERPKLAVDLPASSVSLYNFSLLPALMAPGPLGVSDTSIASPSFRVVPGLHPLQQMYADDIPGHEVRVGDGAAEDGVVPASPNRRTGHLFCGADQLTK